MPLEAEAAPASAASMAAASGGRSAVDPCARDGRSSYHESGGRYGPIAPVDVKELVGFALYDDLEDDIDHSRAFLEARYEHRYLVRSLDP